jgi:flavin-dependent dehydrogenase
VISRFSLDERIARSAAEAGASLRTATTAEALLVEDGKVCGARLRTAAGVAEVVRAPVTVLAEGSAGALARQAPLPAVRGRRTVFAVRRYFEGVRWEGPPRFEIVLPLEADGAPLTGYAWIFPMPGGLANVGVGYLAEAGSPRRLRSLLRWFVEALLRNDPRFGEARAVGRQLGAPIRIGGNGAASSAPGLLLVGDAAGLPNPLWAEGIARALESGVLAARVALDFLGGGAPLSAYSQALARDYPSYHRMAASLPTIYRNIAHVARDLVPLFGTGTALSRAVFGLGEAEKSSRPRRPGLRSIRDEIDRRARTAERRARWLASRDRPVFGEIIDQSNRLPEAPIPAARILLAARARLPEPDLGSLPLRRAAVCMELVRLAVFLLDDLDAELDAEGPGGSRGGGWLAATLGLGLADRILARSFMVASHLSEPARSVVAQALVEVVETLATEAAWSRLGLAATLAAASARAGALLGGAEPGVADALGRAAADATRSVPSGQLVQEFQSRARNITAAGAEAVGGGSGP